MWLVCLLINMLKRCWYKVSEFIKNQSIYLNENENLEDLINNLDFIDVYPWLAVLNNSMTIIF